MKFFSLRSLGCPKNLLDSEVICGSLAVKDWTFTTDLEDASLYIINTCAFLASARAEAEEVIAEGILWKAAEPSERILVVAGCLPEYDRTRRDYFGKFPEVDLWLRVDEIAKLPELLEGKTERSDAADLPHYVYDGEVPRLPLTLSHVKLLKIAEGCDNHCAYCAIPGIRGRLHSRSVESCVREARALIACGAKELVIIAQDITCFGHDTGESLAMLLSQIDKIDGDYVFRLLYTHPAHYTDELIELLPELKHFIHYLDMPLQHIDDRILKRMNRRVTGSEIRRLIARLRTLMPDLVLRTTFITGLPGEGEEEFKALADFAAEIKFERFGVFPYEPEEGTPAAAMLERPDRETAQKRADILMKRQQNRMRRWHNSLIGKRFRMLVDYIDGDYAVARGVMDAPDIDNVVFLPKRGVKPGNFYFVEVIGTWKNDLLGKIVKK